MESAEVEIERIAKIIAAGHYNRKAWYGACTKEERTRWLVDNYWNQFIDVAKQILAIKEKP